MKHEYDALKAILDRFEDKKIMVIGDLLLDHILRGEVTRISPEAPVPVVWAKGLEEDDEYVPGGSCNVARNLAALGAEVSLVGIVGKDKKADKLKSLLRKEGIGTETIVTDPDRPTILKTRIFAGRGLRQQVLRIDRESIDVIPGEIMKMAVGHIEEKICSVDGIIIEDYGKGLITPELIEKVVSLAKANGKIVAVDPKESHFEYYRNVDVITPNHYEASSAVGFEINDEATLKKAGEKLLSEEKAQVILITLGEKGMMVFEKGKEPHLIPTRAQEVSDVSGAGDTVIAVYTLSLVSGASPVEAAEISNCAAGVVVAKSGPAVAGFEEILSHIVEETA